MKIQFASDLHLEFPRNRQFLKETPLTPAADILLLAGDILPIARMERHHDFLSFCADHFEATYWVPGNHEYYGSDISGRVGRFTERVRSNIHLVNNYSTVIEGIHFVFSTLWTPVSISNAALIAGAISDYRFIKDGEGLLTPAKSSELYQGNIAFIQNEIQESRQQNRVVVTHHVPTFDHYPEQYLNSPLNQAFAVDLNEFIIASAIDYWIFGHHHQNVANFFIGKTRMMTNQLGYVELKEHRGFDPQRVIDVSVTAN